AFSDKQLAGTASPGARIAKEIKKRGSRIVTVTDTVLDAITPVQHPTGVVAIGRARPADVRVVMSAVTEHPLVLILAGIQDPGTVGAIVRAAAAFGAAGMIAIEGSANPFSWKALRGGMGSTFRLPIASRAVLSDVLAGARDEHIRLGAAVPRGGTPLPMLDLRRPTAVVLGSEGMGLSGATTAAAQAVGHTAATQTQ